MAHISSREKKLPAGLLDAMSIPVVFHVFAFPMLAAAKVMPRLLDQNGRGVRSEFVLHSLRLEGNASVRGRRRVANRFELVQSEPF